MPRHPLRPVLLTTVAALAVAAPAASAESPVQPVPPEPCWSAPFGPGMNPLQPEFSRLRPHEQVPHAIGPDQLGQIALGPESGVWTVRLAPGPLDLAAARTAIEQRLRHVYSPADADLAMTALRVTPTPYPHAEMVALAQTVTQQLHAAGVTAWGAGPSCRVVVQLFLPNGQAQLDQVRQLMAPHGDKVWVELVAVGPPTASAVPSPAPSAPQAPRPAPDRPAAALPLATVVNAPPTRRCVRGRTVTIRSRAGAKLAVSARGRTRVAAGGKAVRVTLGRRATAVTVKATARDGRTVTRRLTYRRCAAGGR